MIQGYMIVTGRSQDGIKGFIYNLGKTYFIVAMALGVAAGGKFGVRTLTDTLSDGISQIMTGDSDVGSKCLTQETQAILGCKIDRNLTATQSMMGMLDGIDTADSEYLEGKVTQARWFAGVGTAGPAIVAGTMLIMFRIAMALFVGFAPIFILCLLFKKTAPLFQKWLYYGLSTIFSGVMLGVMADISMDLVTNIATTDAVSNITSALLGGGVGGIMKTVTQQLGLGLMLSALLITVPPMAGAWFNGVMGNFNGYSLFSQWNNNSSPTQNGLPPQMGGSSLAKQEVSYNKESNVQNRLTNTLPDSLGHIDNNMVVGTGVKTSVGRGDVVKAPSTEEPNGVRNSLTQDRNTKA